MDNFLLAQFDMLDLQSKKAHISEYGIDLQVSIAVNCYCVALYQLYDFYAEVWHNEHNMVTQIVPFNCYQRLDAFVEHINIKGICTA